MNKVIPKGRATILLCLFLITAPLFCYFADVNLLEFRVATLLVNTSLYCLGCALVTIPLSLFLAFCLQRVILTSRLLCILLLTCVLFLPLPVWVSAWQNTFHWIHQFLPVFSWRAGQPWISGLIPSIWVQSLALIPWCTAISYVSLLTVQRETGDLLLLRHGFWYASLLDVFKNCRGGILLCTAFVAIRCSTEIAVTDMFMLRSFAEEIYLAFNLGDLRTVYLVSSYSVLLSLGFLLLLFFRMSFCRLSIPVNGTLQNAFRRYDLGNPTRIMLEMIIWILMSVFYIFPLFGLVYLTGIDQATQQWQWCSLFEHLQSRWEIDGWVVAKSLYLYLLTGAIASLMSITCAWILVVWKPRCILCANLFLLGFWSLPGPFIGYIGREMIQAIVRLWPNSILADWLYFRPSFLPLLLICVLRVFPVLFVLHSFLLFQRSKIEFDRDRFLDWCTLLFKVRIPLSSRPFLIGTFIGMAFSMNEIGASKFVYTPGTETFSLIIFDRMHYGVGHEVASLCCLLVLLIVIVVSEAFLRLHLFRK